MQIVVDFMDVRALDSWCFDCLYIFYKAGYEELSKPCARHTAKNEISKCLLGEPKCFS